MTLILRHQGPLRDVGARYLADHPEGSPVYPGGALASEAAITRRVEVTAPWPGDRSALHAWLKTENEFAPLHAAQARQLEAASHGNALFLLTGQQPGLLGGPALWYAKAMTCAAWARRLTEQLRRPVIPIFWVAGDDSDLAECNAVEWLETGAPASGGSLDFPDPRDPIPMSRRILTEDGAAGLQQQLRSVWNAGTAALAAGYQPGCSLTQAFLRLAQSLLGPDGMLFVDGFAAAARAQPFLRRMISAAPRFQQALGTGARRLKETRFGIQVPERPGSVPAFALQQDRRVRLFFSETKNHLRVFAQGMEDRDLSSELEQHILLHSALSRPLVAESLFPVLGHVLGPAELRYFAQLADVFPAFGFSMPPLAPRQQVLLCSEQDWNRLEALGLQPSDLPGFTPSRLRAGLAERAWKNHRASKEFPDADFQALAGSLRRYQENVLPEAGGLAAAGRRLESAFARYREAARQAVFRREAAAVYTSFLPLLKWLGNGAQDRHLNLLSVYDTLGPDGFAAFSDRLRNPTPEIRVMLYGTGSNAV